MEGKLVLDLPQIMATLKIGGEKQQKARTEDVVIPEETCRDIRKSLRKQTGRPSYLETTNRRCSLKPTKLDDGCEGYYLNRKLERRKVPCLETIYEEPQVRRNGEVKLLGAKKSRKIMFRTVAKAKTKRKKGSSSSGGGGAGGLKRSRKMTMDEFIKQMRAVSES